MAKYRKLHCSFCEQEQSFRKPRVNHSEYFGLTVLTAGVGFIPWMFVSIRRWRSPWRCRYCGRSYRGEQKEAAPRAGVFVSEG